MALRFLFFNKTKKRRALRYKSSLRCGLFTSIPNAKKKKNPIQTYRIFYKRKDVIILAKRLFFYFVYNRFKSFRIVHR